MSKLKSLEELFAGRQCGGSCPGCRGQGDKAERVRVSGSDTGRAEAPPSVHETLRSAGRPLDGATRSFMEPRFGHDFSRVRVHSGSTAERIGAGSQRARVHGGKRDRVRARAVRAGDAGREVAAGARG